MKTINQRKEKNPMKTANKRKTLWLSASLVWALSLPAQAGLINNGGFESGFSGWTIADQVGGDGTFFLQTGTASLVNGFVVPAPPEGTTAAMTDSQGPGSHVLYQDFVVPGSVSSASIGFSLFINNHNDNGPPNFFTPATLDFATTNLNGTTNLNQQARVDIISASADPFSLAAADVFQNLFQTATADPLVSGYTSFLIDITALLQVHPGETLRLRFAETDNVNFFNLGVDDVSLTTQVPEPSSLLLMALYGFSGLAVWMYRRRGRTLAR